MLLIGPLSKVFEPHITRRCGSLTKPSARLRFHPTPDSLCKSLAIVFGLARRCGQRVGVDLRSACHPTSDLLTATRTFSFTLSPTTDSRPVPPLRVTEPSSFRPTSRRRPITYDARVSAPPLLALLRRCGSWSLLPIGVRTLSHSI